MSPVEPTGRVTRADVAAAAGTSVAVVSYVVNNGPRPVAHDTRARVLAAIELTGYRPDAVARALAGGSTRTFGLLVPDVSNRFFAELAHHVEEHAFAVGHLILLADSADDPQRERELMHALIEHRVDGIMLASADADPDLTEALATGTPVVQLDRVAPDAQSSSVTADHEGGARSATAHLVGHGYRRIALVCGPAHLPTAHARRSGWAAALADAGLEAGPVVEAPFSRVGGLDAGRTLLAGPDRPDAVFVSSDQQALGLLRAAHDLGIRVPDDLGLLTFDGTQDAVYAVPSLSSVVQPLDELAAHAVRLLTTRPHRPARLTTGHRLALRASCGCADRPTSP